MKKFKMLWLFLLGAAGFYMLAHYPSMAVEGTLESRGPDLSTDRPDGFPVATIAGGCFWCVESEFRTLEGILHTRVGYIGGDNESPTYEQITTGKTGHAEAVELTFDPTKITYAELIEFFLEKAHDPTQLNRQGVDIGTQYRSEIFYHDEAQRTVAKEIISNINAEGIYSKPIVTKLSPAVTFWVAEDYHQQYYEKYEQNNNAIHPRVVFKKRMKAIKGY